MVLKHFFRYLKTLHVKSRNGLFKGKNGFLTKNQKYFSYFLLFNQAFVLCQFCLFDEFYFDKLVKVTDSMVAGSFHRMLCVLGTTHFSIFICVPNSTFSFVATFGFVVECFASGIPRTTMRCLIRAPDCTFEVSFLTFSYVSYYTFPRTVTNQYGFAILCVTNGIGCNRRGWCNWCNSCNWCNCCIGCYCCFCHW